MLRIARLQLIGLSDTDDEELLGLGRQLRSRLLALDASDVQLARSMDNTMRGAKGGDLIAAGSVAVTAGSLVLRQAVSLANTWMKNRPVRGIRVELEGRVLELSNASPTEQEHLIEAFLALAEKTNADNSSHLSAEKA